MPAKLFQKGREEGNTFPYLCQVLNPIDGQYHSTCHFHWSPDFTGPVQPLSLISVEMTLLLVPVLRELRDVFDICKKYSLLHMHWAEVGLVLSLDIMWGGLLRSLRKDCDSALTGQCLRCGADFLLYIPSNSATKMFMKMLKSTDPKMVPCWTPLVTEKNFIN